MPAGFHPGLDNDGKGRDRREETRSFCDALLPQPGVAPLTPCSLNPSPVSSAQAFTDQPPQDALAILQLLPRSWGVGALEPLAPCCLPGLVGHSFFLFLISWLTPHFCLLPQVSIIRVSISVGNASQLLGFLPLKDSPSGGGNRGRIGRPVGPLIPGPGWNATPLENIHLECSTVAQLRR